MVSMAEPQSPPFDLAYDAALRALQDQNTSLDGLRARAAALIAATAIVTSFLGGQALEPDGFSAWEVAALLFFGLGVLLCLLVLMPQEEGWLLTTDPAVMVERMNEQPDFSHAEWQAALAWEVGEALPLNDERLRRVHMFFALACGCLILEIALWAIDLL
jgi:hypothetical protein